MSILELSWYVVVFSLSSRTLEFQTDGKSLVVLGSKGVSGGAKEGKEEVSPSSLGVATFMCKYYCKREQKVVRLMLSDASLPSFQPVSKPVFYKKVQNLEHERAFL